MAKTGRRLPLGLRLSGMITLLAIVAMSLLSLVILGKQGQLQNEQLQDLGNGLASQMASAVTEAVFTNDETSLIVQVQQFAQLPRIVALQVSDQQQVLASAGDIEELVVQIGSGHYFRSEIRFKDVVGGEVQLLLQADSLSARYAQMLRLVVAVMGGLSVLALLAAYVISRRISKPISELLSVTTDISAKDFDKKRHDNSERRHDELGQLIEAVNQMGHGLYQKSQIEQRLAGFVNKEIAEQIINRLDTVQLGTEKVDASVMFADIVGFTAMSEKMTPEQVAALLNEYFYYFTQCAKHFFGTIDKFIGDCVMVMFGAPKADDNHRFHAVACAVLISHLLEQLNVRREQQGLPTVQLRIGINSGEMVAGVLGSADKMEYSVVGDAVNLASRLCSEADPGQIIISEHHYQQLQEPDQVVVTEHQHLQVRGKQQAVNTYLVNDVAFKQKARINSAVDDILSSRRPS